MNRKRLLLVCLAVILFALAAAPLASVVVNDWWAAGAAGSPVRNGSIQLYGISGQNVSGLSSAAGVELCSGYLCAPLWMPITLYLPLTLR